MRKLIPLTFVVLLVWCSVLSVFLYRSHQTAIQAEEIEEVRQGVSNIADLTYRVPILMKLAVDDILGPENRSENFQIHSESTSFDLQGNSRAVSYVFKLPESVPASTTEKILGRFRYYCGNLVGLNQDWPIEVGAGLSKLKIELPEPDQEKREIYLDVAVRYSPYVRKAD